MSAEAKQVLAKIIHREEPELSLEEILEEMNNEEHREHRELWVDVALEAMKSYAREYHAKEMERKLGTVHGSHIEEAGFYSMRNQANSYDKRYGFIKGAKWLLNHLKEDKG